MRMTQAAGSAGWIRFVPNVLSAFRLGVAIAFPFAPPTWRLGAVIAGGASDWLDGLIARRFNVKSVIGGLLDAIADKLFVLSVLVTLILADSVQWWQAVAVMLRDFAVLIVAVSAAVVRRWESFSRMTPGAAGKLTTLLVFAWFIFLLIPLRDAYVMILLIMAIASSAVAAIDYLSRFARALIEDQASPTADRNSPSI